MLSAEVEHYIGKTNFTARWGISLGGQKVVLWSTSTRLRWSFEYNNIIQNFHSLCIIYFVYMLLTPPPICCCLKLKTHITYDAGYNYNWLYEKTHWEINKFYSLHSKKLKLICLIMYQVKKMLFTKIFWKFVGLSTYLSYFC